MPGKEIKGRSKRVMYRDGSLKPVNKTKNPGLSKLPTKVRKKEKQQQKESLRFILQLMQTCMHQEFVLEK